LKGFDLEPDIRTQRGGGTAGVEDFGSERGTLGRALKDEKGGIGISLVLACRRGPKPHGNGLRAVVVGAAILSTRTACF